MRRETKRRMRERRGNSFGVPRRDGGEEEQDVWRGVREERGQRRR